MAQVKGGKTAWWQKDATPGYLLLVATALSFALLNGPTSTAWQAVLKAPVALALGGYALSYDVKAFIKDALMAVFFLFVGLELKRECMEGPLRNPKEAALPLLGALGGMAAPALIYFVVATQAHPAADPLYARGWAIPSATDIAFAVGVLSLLGARVPAGLRLFILTLAVADDLGAIVVIALFYSESFAAVPLMLSAFFFACLMAFNRGGVKALTPYWVVGLLLWGAMAKSGVSPTLAGVLTALAIPMTASGGKKPLVAAEHALKPYVQLGVMPIFALAIAGVQLAGVGASDVFHPVALGIAAGLAIGKPVGISLFAWMGSKLLKQPAPASFLQMIGGGMIAGIGFTMALFVGALAFKDPALQTPVRFGVLGGSLISGCLGLLVLHLTLGQGKAKPLSPSLAKDEKLCEDEGILEKR
ncbi:MAG: Na+/H+ antiporter NhaA [Caulobacterales bacterium]